MYVCEALCISSVVKIHTRINKNQCVCVYKVCGLLECNTSGWVVNTGGTDIVNQINTESFNGRSVEETGIWALLAGTHLRLVSLHTSDAGLVRLAHLMLDWSGQHTSDTGLVTHF